MLDVMEKELEMVNVSTLPLTVTLSLNYPFTLVHADQPTQRQSLVMQSGEVVRMKVLFDPCYKTEDWICRSINSQITVSYKEHPHIVSELLFMVF